MGNNVDQLVQLAIEKDFEKVKELFANGFDVRKVYISNSRLVNIINNSSEEIVKFIFANGAELSTRMSGWFKEVITAVPEEKIELLFRCIPTILIGEDLDDIVSIDDQRKLDILVQLAIDDQRKLDQLVQLAIEKDFEKVKELFANGFDVRKVYISNSRLVNIINNSSEEIVKFIFANGADLGCGPLEKIIESPLNLLDIIQESSFEKLKLVLSYLNIPKLLKEECLDSSEITNVLKYISDRKLEIFLSHPFFKYEMNSLLVKRLAVSREFSDEWLLKNIGAEKLLLYSIVKEKQVLFQKIVEILENQSEPLNIEDWVGQYILQHRPKEADFIKEHNIELPKSSVSFIDDNEKTTNKYFIKRYPRDDYEVFLRNYLSAKIAQNIMGEDVVPNDGIIIDISGGQLKVISQAIDGFISLETYTKTSNVPDYHQYSEEKRPLINLLTHSLKESSFTGYDHLVVAANFICHNDMHGGNVGVIKLESNLYKFSLIDYDLPNNLNRCSVDKMLRNIGTNLDDYMDANKKLVNLDLYKIKQETKEYLNQYPLYSGVYVELDRRIETLVVKQYLVAKELSKMELLVDIKDNGLKFDSIFDAAEAFGGWIISTPVTGEFKLTDLPQMLDNYDIW